jgi:hypothetical protein
MFFVGHGRNPTLSHEFRRLVSTGQNYDTPNRLVFVLGAGAMTDYGFPIGWHVGDENELAADNRLVGSSRVFFGVRPDNQISAP